MNERFITVGSIPRSGICGRISEPRGKFRVTGRWQQMVNATGWVAHFLEELTTEFVAPIRKRWKASKITLIDVNIITVHSEISSQYR